MEKHYHAQDIIDILKKAKETNQPVYQAGGPCGGCDLLIGPKEMPTYQAKGQCGGCDIVRPSYQAEGSCGGCDITIEKPKMIEIDVDQMLKRLEEVHPLEPVYLGKGPCSGCDVPPFKRNE